MGLFALLVHPISHGFTLHDDLTTEERNEPLNHEVEECLECILTQITGSEVNLSESISYLLLLGETVSEGRTEIISDTRFTLSLRAPPSIYV